MLKFSISMQVFYELTILGAQKYLNRGKRIGKFSLVSVLIPF